MDNKSIILYLIVKIYDKHFTKITCNGKFSLPVLRYTKQTLYRWTTPDLICVIFMRTRTRVFVWCVCMCTFLFTWREGIHAIACVQRPEESLWIWISPGIFVSLWDQGQIFKLVLPTSWLMQSAHQPETLLKKYFNFVFWGQGLTKFPRLTFNQLCRPRQFLNLLYSLPASASWVAENIYVCIYVH